MLFKIDLKDNFILNIKEKNYKLCMIGKVLNLVFNV